MPRHEQVSPEEDLASFYGGADPASVTGAARSPMAAPAPIAPDLAAPLPGPSTPPRAAPPPVASYPAAERPAAPSLTVRPPAPPPAPASLAPTSPDPILAALLSLVLPGVGQIMAGQAAKGAVMLVIAVLTCAFGGLFNLLAAVDAYLIAQRKKRGEVVGDWQFF